jgi:hypothetical protein
MAKKIIFSVIVVFVVWSILDFVIHQLILGTSYQATANLWRPMTEMKMGLMYGVVFLVSIAFVCLFAFFVENRGVKTGFFFGLIYGLGAGLSMGYGTYSVMPIPYYMALTWFLGTVVEYVAAGLLVGWICRKK